MNKSIVLSLLSITSLGITQTVTPAASSHSNNSWQHKSNAIYFYNKTDPYYCFTNFFHLNPKKRGHRLDIDGHTWRSSEHYFQAQKFNYKHQNAHTNNQVTSTFHAILNAKTARDAFNIAQTHAHLVRRDWHTVDANGLTTADRTMMRALWEKFTQNPQLHKDLIATGKKTLIEDSPYDAYWGRGKNWDGHNQLGQMLMYIRWLFNKNYTPGTQHSFKPFGAAKYR